MTECITEITILSDGTTGKLMQKYLAREKFSVSLYSQDEHVADRQTDIFILDVSDFRDDITGYLLRFHELTGCMKYILITSMDKPLSAIDAGRTSGRISVKMIAKPLKLSALLYLVESELQERGLLQSQH